MLTIAPTHTHAPQQKAGNLVCTHLKKLRKLIRNKSMELDEYDQGEDLVREGSRLLRAFIASELSYRKK